MSAPWYGVYLWVTLGNGFRYGERYLYLSCAASLLGFGYVVTTSPYWIANTELAIGLALTLLIIPGYSGVLIRRLNDALQRADAASRAKSDFLSCMSHEIRTPLNGILGMTDLLRLRPLGSEDKECVDTIHASGQALARQINDILDLSKIEAGELSLETIDFDLYALINATLRIFQPQVNAKQLQLREDLDPKTPYLLSGDPHKLRQVIINLVGNAIKFTDRGFVTVRVYPREFTAAGAVLRFEVSDTGVGIPPERQQAVFEPFTQADSSVARNYGGTGLGTTICKNIVELMGGRIGLHSTPGVGSTFWFDIPFATGATAGIDSQAWTGDCRVLYLPAAGARNETAAELRAWGMPYDTATTLEEAVERVQARREDARPYHALLLDSPLVDEKLQALLCAPQGNDRLAPTTLILITAGPLPQEIDPERLERLFVLNGATDKRILLNALHASYSRQSTEEDIIHIAGHQVRAQCTATPLDLLVVDDNATNRIVLQRMLERLGHRCTTLAGGAATLEELEQRDYDAVIIDRNMPDLGGLETYQAYCMAHGGRPPVPFIILTADATEECRELCLAAGIELFMTKPVSLAKLQETLAAIGKREPGDSESPVAAPAAQAPQDGEQPVLDEAEFGNLVSLAAGNQDFLVELIRNFEADAANDIRELEAALANRDWTAFRDSAHALKGGALYLGLSRLARLSLEAQMLEQDEFDREGIACLRNIQRAAGEAIHALHNKGAALRQAG